jgi:hypothetical protein
MDLREKIEKKKKFGAIFSHFFKRNHHFSKKLQTIYVIKNEFLFFEEAGEYLPGGISKTSCLLWIEKILK